MRHVSSSRTPAARIERLEHICAQLWSSEPPAEAHADRTRLFRQLGEIDRRITSLSLRLTVDAAVHDQIDEALRRCERRLAELQSIWRIADDELLAG